MWGGRLPGSLGGDAFLEGRCGEEEEIVWGPWLSAEPTVLWVAACEWPPEKVWEKIDRAKPWTGESITSSPRDAGPTLGSSVRPTGAEASPLPPSLLQDGRRQDVWTFAKSHQQEMLSLPSSL